MVSNGRNMQHVLKGLMKLVVADGCRFSSFEYAIAQLDEFKKRHSTLLRVSISKNHHDEIITKYLRTSVV
jgi:hypothetical protein